MSQTRPELEDAAAHARPQTNSLGAVVARDRQNLLVGRDLGRAALALPRDLRRREAVGEGYSTIFRPSAKQSWSGRTYTTQTLLGAQQTTVSLVFTTE